MVQRKKNRELSIWWADNLASFDLLEFIEFRWFNFYLSIQKKTEILDPWIQSRKYFYTKYSTRENCILKIKVSHTILYPFFFNFQTFYKCICILCIFLAIQKLWNKNHLQKTKTGAWKKPELVNPSVGQKRKETQRLHISYKS